MRRWNDDGIADEDDGTTLDYSVQSSGQNGMAVGQSDAPMEVIDSRTFGTRTEKGQFVLKDLENEVHSILQNANEKKPQPAQSRAGVVGSSLGAISGLFRNVIGGKVLTKDDLVKPMKGMEEHLLKKNVAREAALRLCEGVEKELIGIKTGSFESILSHYLTKCQGARINNSMLDRCRFGYANSNGIISAQNIDAHNVP